MAGLLTAHLGRCTMPLNPGATMSQKFTIELEEENDGRWIAGIPALPGVMEAVRSVQALAVHVLAEDL
jgi:hypothetical protein